MRTDPPDLLRRFEVEANAKTNRKGGDARVSWKQCVVGMAVAATMLAAGFLLVPLLRALFDTEASHVGSPWSNLARFISKSGDASYIDFMDEILQAIRYSYTATHGSDYNPIHASATLGEGWERVKSLDEDPEDGGFQGLVFHQVETGRLIIAIKGSDLDIGGHGQQDLCAGMLLFGSEYTNIESLPGPCQSYSEEDLDYLTLAGAFVDRALKALKPSGTLIVGHSMGAALAVLVAAEMFRSQSWHPHVLGLSAPNFTDALLSKVHHEFSSLPAQRLVLINNFFDPLTWWSEGSKGLTICTFKPLPETEECSTCRSQGGAQEDWWDLEELSDECHICFGETHFLKSYLQNLRGSVQQPPLHRPSCKR